MFEKIPPWIRRLLGLILILLALDKRFSLRARWADSKRRHAMLLALPGPTYEEEHWLLGHMGGSAFILPGEKFSPEFLATVLVKRLQALAERFKGRDQVSRVFAASSKFPTTQLSFVLVHGIEAVREILSRKGMDDWQKGRSYEIASVLIGNSVLRAHGKAWAEQRPAVERGMSHLTMEKSVPRILQTVNELISNWETIAKRSGNTQSVNLAEESLKLTLDVIGRAAFSFDFGSITAQRTEDAPLYGPFQTILKTLDRRCLFLHEHYLRDLPTQANREFNEAINVLNEQVDRIIAERVTGGKVYDDFLQILIAQDVPPHLVRDNVKTMLFAGHDTTAAALTWALRLLATNPTHLKRAREEVLKHFGADGDPAYDDLERLDFVNAVVLETLRLYPSAAFTRQADHDVPLDGGKVVIPAWTEMLVVPYIIHRDSKHWDRPEEFVPERFLDMGVDHQTNDTRGNSLQSRIGRICAKKAYFPFSLGPRNCAGRPLALVEMRVVLVKLLQKFSFQVPKDETFAPTIPVFQITLNPIDVRIVPVLL